MGSKRLYGKVLRWLNDERIIFHIAKRAQALDDCEVVFALADGEDDGKLGHEISRRIKKPRAVPEGYGEQPKGLIVSGPEQDVLTRMLQAANYREADVIYRITADNPLLDKTVVDLTRKRFDQTKADYAYMMGLPDGCAVEIFTLESFLRVDKLAIHPDLREHPTMAYYVHSDEFRLCFPFAPVELQARYRLTIDERDDLLVMQAIFQACGDDVTVQQAIEYLDSHPDIAKINSHIQQEARIGFEFANTIATD